MEPPSDPERFNNWRHPNPRTSRYLTHVATLGYTLSPVEERARESAEPDDE